MGEIDVERERHSVEEYSFRPATRRSTGVVRRAQGVSATHFRSPPLASAGREKNMISRSVPKVKRPVLASAVAFSKSKTSIVMTTQSSRILCSSDLIAIHFSKDRCSCRRNTGSLLVSVREKSLVSSMLTPRRDGPTTPQSTCQELLSVASAEASFRHAPIWPSQSQLFLESKIKR